MRFFDTINEGELGDGEFIAKCDYTGAPCLHSDLVRQYEYTASGLEWTGMWVDRNNAFEPNPSLLNAPIFSDPTPLDPCKPREKYLLPEAPVLITPGLITSNSITISWEKIKGAQYYNVFWEDMSTQYNIIADRMGGIVDDVEPYNTIDELPKNPIYTIEGLKPDTSYLIKVACICNVAKRVTYLGDWRTTDPERHYTYDMSAETDVRWALTVKTKAN